MANTHASPDFRSQHPYSTSGAPILIVHGPDDNQVTRRCLWRQPAQTVHPTTSRMPDCAYGDSLSSTLCIRRQPEFQTVPLASNNRLKWALVVARGTVWRAACRQRHSLVGGSGGIDRQRQQETRLHPRRQLEPDLAPFLSPGRQSERQVVAGTSVWPEGCRRRHSLGSHATRTALCLLTSWCHHPRRGRRPRSSPPALRSRRSNTAGAWWPESSATPHGSRRYHARP